MKSILKDEKGNIADIWIATIAFLVVVVAGGIIWYVFALIQVDLSLDPDFSEHMEALNSALDTMRFLNWGSVGIFIAMVASALISAYFIGSKPIFFLVHAGVLLILVIGSKYVSNVYYEITTDPDIGAFILAKMTMPTLILYNLPFVVSICGFATIIALVAKYAYDNQGPSSGGSGGLPGD